MKAPFSNRFLMCSLVMYVAGLQAQSRFVYTNNDLFTTNSISGFSVDANGILTEISGSPFATGGGGIGGGGFAVNRITVAGGGKFLYASNGADHSISGFSIETSSGFLTQITGSPFSAGANAGWGDISLAGSPDGKFLFAGVASNRTVMTFSISADGSLSQVASTNVPAMPAGIKVSADGTLLAVGLPGYSAGAVAMFSIAANGALTMVNGIPFFDSGAGNLASVDMNCSGMRLFGGEMIQGTTTVDVFSIASGGVLSRIQGSPFSPGVGMNSNVAVLSPNDRFLFVTNQSSATVTVFAVDSAGALLLVGGSPFVIGAGSSPAGAATDETGSFLYVASSSSAMNSPNLIHVFNIAADGSLAAVQGSPFSTAQTGSSLISLAAYPDKTCSAPSGGTPPPEPPPPPPPADPPPASGAMIVKIDIKPEGPENKLNPTSRGKIKVAILSSSSFNAPAQVDMNSLTFGHAGDEKSLAFCNIHREDHDHDNRPDLICYFDTPTANFQKGDTVGILKGRLLNGNPIQGSDSVHLVH